MSPSPRQQLTAVRALAGRIGWLRALVVGLELHPGFRGGAEGLGEKPGGLGGDAALAADDLVDALHGHPEMLGKGDLGDPHGNEEFLEEDLAWVDGNSLVRSH